MHTRSFFFLHVNFSFLCITDENSVLLCLTETSWWISTPLSTVGTVHFGVSQQVKAGVTLIDHRAAGMKVRPLKQAVLQRMRRPTGHSCDTQTGQGNIIKDLALFFFFFFLIFTADKMCFCLKHPFRLTDRSNNQRAVCVYALRSQLGRGWLHSPLFWHCSTGSPSR